MKRRLLFILFQLLFTGFAVGQEFVVTDQTDGGETQVTHRFLTGKQDFEFMIVNNLTREASVEIRLVANDEFQKSAYTILEQFPVKVAPGSRKGIHFSANYNKWIKELTQVSLDIYRVPSDLVGGEKKRIHRVQFSFSAEGKLQFWNPRYTKLTSWLSPIEMSTQTTDARERIVEIRRIGSSPVPCQIQISADFRGSFKMYSNEMRSRKLGSGDTITVGGGGRSFIIQYVPPAGGDKGWLDSAVVTFSSTENPNNRISFELKGRLGTGPMAAVTVPTSIDPGNLNFQDVATVPVEGEEQPQSIGSGMSLQDSLARVKFVRDSLRADSVRRVAIPEIQAFLARYRMVDLVHDSVLAAFRLDSGIWAAKIPLEMGKIEKGNMGLIPDRMLLNPGDQQVELQVLEFYYDTLGGHIILAMPGEYAGPMGDTLPLVMRYVPYYITADKDTFVPEEDDYRMRTESPAIVYSPPKTLLYILIGLGVLFLLFLILLRRKLAKPIPELGYLKELQYQKYRSGADTKARIEAEVIEVDLNRHDLDLVQLQFPGMVLKGTVQPPEQSRFKRILKFIFFIPRRPRFRAFYYSFRIDPVYERLPEELLLKDEEGLFLLETDMTKEILATDHQDFILTDAEINYQIFLDTTEIIGFDGPAKIVKIQFTLTEEPFEGYSKYHQFVVPVKITPKRNF